MVLLLLYYICLHSVLPFVFYSTSLLLLSHYTMHVPWWISFVISLPPPVCLCSRSGFQYMLFDSDLLIHVCLPLHATWHSPHHSLESFWLPWIVMSRSRSLELVNSPCCWSEMRSYSMDHWQAVWGLILPGPPARLEFPFRDSWAPFAQFMILYHFVFLNLRLLVM